MSDTDTAPRRSRRVQGNDSTQTAEPSSEATTGPDNAVPPVEEETVVVSEPAERARNTVVLRTAGWSEFVTAPTETAPSYTITPAGLEIPARDAEAVRDSAIRCGVDLFDGPPQA